MFKFQTLGKIFFKIIRIFNSIHSENIYELLFCPSRAHDWRWKGLTNTVKSKTR